VSLLLQQLLVGALVAACALYSAWRLASVRLRLRALDLLGGVPLARGTRALAWLQQRTLGKITAACGGCSQASSHLKSRAPESAAKPASAAPNQTPGVLRRC
jgi:hypothetical protein